MTSTLAVDPLFRIQVLLQHDIHRPTREFKVEDLVEPTFEALLSHIFSMSKLSIEDKNDYNSTFKYRLEEKHDSRWVNFADTRGFGFALEGNQDKGYVFISACIVKKGAKPPPVVATAAARVSTPATKTKTVKKAKPTKAKASSPSSRGGGGGSLEQKILGALKELYELGITAPPRIQVALFSGHKSLKTKSFANALSKLAKSQGLIEYPDSKTVALTQAGIAKAGSVSPPTSNEQVHAKICALLGGTEVKIFNELVDGACHSREDVATSIGLTSIKTKSFANCLSKMSSLGFLEYVKGDGKGSNGVRLTDIAFPLGRPASTGARALISNDE